MPFQSIPSRTDVHRIILQVEQEGTYMFMFEKPSSQYPEKDYLYDDLDAAMDLCRNEYGISKEAWEEVTGDWL